jgi:hypothetical protein
VRVVVIAPAVFQFLSVRRDRNKKEGWAQPWREMMKHIIQMDLERPVFSKDHAAARFKAVEALIQLFQTQPGGFAHNHSQAHPLSLRARLVIYKTEQQQESENIQKFFIIYGSLRVVQALLALSKTSIDTPQVKC